MEGIIGNPGATNLATSGYRITPGPRYALIEIRPDWAKLEALMARVRNIPNAVPRVLVPALNQSAAEEKTWLARRFGERLRILRKKSIPDRLTLTPKASRASMVAGVQIDLTRFTIASFPTQRTAYGIWWTSGSSAGGRIIPRSFMQAKYTHYQTGKEMDVTQVYRRAQRGEKGFAQNAVNRAGHRVRATRAGDIVQRYSIKVLRGPSLAKVFSDDPGFQAEAERQGVAILEKKVAQQVDRLAAEVANG
jgi:hypothetical protein